MDQLYGLNRKSVTRHAWLGWIASRLFLLAAFLAFTQTANAQFIQSLSPSSGSPGQTLSVTVTGNGTHFQQGVSVADFGPDITVNSLTVNSPTVLIVNITIGLNQSTGGQVMKITTGSENAFNNFNIVGDTTVPAVGGGGTITASNVATTTLTLSWAKATDNVSSGSSLQYEVRRALTNNIGSVVSAEGATLVQPYAADIATVNVTGLTASTTYYFNVIVKDQAGNNAVYTTVSATTTVPDTVGPSPGGSGVIVTSAITPTGLTLTWTKATDAVSAQSVLQYQVRRSLSDNMGSVATAELNGTVVQEYTTDIATANVTGLAASTPYYFNVIVKDEAGNKRVYTTVSATTTAPTLTISPSSGLPGQTLSINMTGTGTHFVNGVTTADFGPNITVNSVTVTNATFAVANITVGAGAAEGPRTMSVTTGTEVVTKTFTVTGDTTTPIPGSTGTIIASNIAPTSLTLTWTKATDNVSAQSVLQYEVRRSLTNNISTVVEAESGTLVQAYTADIATVNVTGLDSSTAYFFNVLVKDAAGNKAVYTTVSATTAGPTLTISPSSGLPGQTLSINMTGTGTHFVNGVTTADFGPNITVNSVTVTNATFAVANITVGAGAAEGPRTMSVTTGTEVVTKTFTVTGDTTPPIPGSTGTITISNLAPTGLTLSWTKATDNVSAQSALQYEVRQSLSNNIGTIANAESNGSVIMSYAADMTTFTITGLAPSTSHFFTVIVKDVAGNKALYGTVNGTTTADTIAPLPGSSGTITTSNVAITSLTLAWTKATDTVSPQAALQYEVRRSTSNNIATVANAEANGTIVQAYSTDIATANVTGLTASTSYFFNVIVKDFAGNKAAYSTQSATTTGASTTTITLTASPATITPGQSTTLSWAVTNATSVTIDNGVGSVSATGGTMVVTPNLTTTFIATATGPGGATATSSAVVTVVTATYSVPVDAARSFGVGDPTGPLTVGSVIMQVTEGTDAPNGNGVVGYRAGGVSLVEAAIPALTPILSGRFLAQIDNNTNIGVAFTNPNTSTSATITFYFTDSSGVSTTPGTMTLGPGQQTSAFLDQSPFNGTRPFQGSFTFASNVPLAALGIKGYFNERGEFLFTTSPVAPLGTAPSSDPLVIPLYASGGGWTTEVILTNPTDSAQTGTVQFVAQDGGFAQTLVNGVLSSTFSYLIQPRGTFQLLAANSGGTTVTGSIRVMPASGGVPFATGIFAFKAGGVTISQSSVSASPRSTAYRLYVERSGSGAAGTTRSGVAITNTSDSPTPVLLELRQMDGQQVGLLTLPALPAGGQVSRFVDELFPNIPATFRGTLRVSAASGGASIVVTGIRARINERNDFLFAATPASDENAAAYSGTLVFTHVVYGGGYSTELILFGDTSGNTGGTMIHRSSDGVLRGTGSLQAQP